MSKRPTTTASRQQRPNGAAPASRVSQEQQRFDLNGVAPAGSKQEAGVAYLPGTKISSRWEQIDGAKAEEYLATRKRGRDLMASLWGKYAQDKRLGQWVTTHQGAAFEEDGSLIDGNHRLKAISEAGVTEWMLVTRGLGADAIEALDRGRLRTLAHTLQIMGFDLCTPAAVAAARAACSGPKPVWGGGDKPTEVTLRKFMEAHREALLFASSLPAEAVRRAGVAACLARAFYHVAPERLSRFARAMADQIDASDVMPGDRTARRLLACLERRKRHHGMRGREVYCKTQYALSQHLAGVDRDRIDSCEEDLYPLPEAAASAASAAHPAPPAA